MDVPPVKLSELLRHPDDLDKIAALKQEFTRRRPPWTPSYVAACATSSRRRSRE